MGSHVILFLGAGVSKLFDVPDMMGFGNIFEEDPRISENEIFEKIQETFGIVVDLEILMTILEDLKKDKEELLMSMSPQTAAFLLRNGAKSDYYLTDGQLKKKSAELIKIVKDIVRNKCLNPEKDRLPEILDVYDRFFNTITEYSSGRASSGAGNVLYPSDLRVFTTNYDRCIETYFGNRQIDFTQGLVQKFGYSLLDVSKYDDRGAKVGLFKLHGTVDLFNVEGIVRQRRYMEELGEELIYYPTEFSGYNHVIESPYLELFYLFRERLAQDNAWLIIGSSLRDRTICSIMDSVISLKQENQRPKVILTNPDIGVRNRLALSGFKYLSKSLRHIPKSFGSDEITKEIGQALTEAENG